VSQTVKLLEQIQTACSEQELGVGQINQAVSQMDGITQQNAAMVEEMAAAARTLDLQVAHVHNTIRVFKLTDKDVTLAEEDAVALRKALGGKAHDEGDAGLDFDRVLEAHQQWRIKLRNAALKGTQMDVATVRRDDCCELGTWLHGAGGQRWGRVPGFSELLNQHRAFHQEAGKIAELINQKQTQAAQQLLEGNTPFIQLGQKLTSLLRQLRATVEGGASRLALGHAPSPQAKPQAAAPSASRASSDTDDWTSF